MFTEEDVIHRYTRAEALADGELVEVPFAAEFGVRVHAAMTRALYAEIVRGADDTDSFGGRSVTMLRCYRQAAQAFMDEAQCSFHFHVGRGPRKRTLKCWGVVGPGDNAEPVLTFMLEGES